MHRDSTPPSGSWEYYILIPTILSSDWTWTSLDVCRRWDCFNLSAVFSGSFVFWLCLSPEDSAGFCVLLTVLFCCFSVWCTFLTSANTSPSFVVSLLCMFLLAVTALSVSFWSLTVACHCCNCTRVRFCFSSSHFFSVFLSFSVCVSSSFCNDSVFWRGTLWLDFIGCMFILVVWRIIILFLTWSWTLQHILFSWSFSSSVWSSSSNLRCSQTCSGFGVLDKFCCLAVVFGSSLLCWLTVLLHWPQFLLEILILLALSLQVNFLDPNLFTKHWQFIFAKHHLLLQLASVFDHIVDSLTFSLELFSVSYQKLNFLLEGLIFLLKSLFFLLQVDVFLLSFRKDCWQMIITIVKSDFF